MLEASTEAERWRAGLPVCPPEHSIAHGLVARSGLLVRDGEITTTLLRCEDRCECCNQWRGGYLALAQRGAPTLRLTGLGERAPSIFARHNAYDCEWRAWHHAALDRPVTVIGQLESDVLHALEVCEPSQD